VPRRTFDVIDIVEILTHWYAGRSQHELAASLGVDRETLRKYTAPAVAAGFAPGGPPMAEADWRTLVCEWFPALGDTRLRQVVSWPAIEPHRDYIHAQLKAGVTAATVHQRLVDEHGLDASVASLRRWVRANLPEQVLRSQVTVLRDAPPPGEQAQIDYGRLGMWRDPATGRRRAVWAFVMVLACCRHMFVRPTLSMDQAEWTAAHVEAFAFFGDMRVSLPRSKSCEGHAGGVRQRGDPRLGPRQRGRWPTIPPGEKGGTADHPRHDVAMLLGGLRRCEVAGWRCCAPRGRCRGCWRRARSTPCWRR